ncbi:MAG: LysM peptidoglycan-binding domain-containing protein [Pseudomonadota bacterium]
MTTVRSSTSVPPKPVAPKPTTPAVGDDTPQRKPSQPPPANDAKPGSTYTVKPGDTLSKIAKEAYGDPMRWPDIARANQDKLSDPNHIAPGQKLKLPQLDPADPVRAAKAEKAKEMWEAHTDPGMLKPMPEKDPRLDHPAANRVPELKRGLTNVEQAPQGTAAQRSAPTPTGAPPPEQGAPGSSVSTPAPTASAPPSPGGLTPEQQRQVDDAANRINGAANNIQGTDRPYEGSGSEKNARREATLEASRTLDETLRSVPPELRDDVLQQTQGAVDKIGRGMTILDGNGTQEAARNLASATEAAGRDNAHLITDPMAKVISSGGMEEHGSFLGRDDHRSEQEFVNGVRGNMAQPGGDLFARSMANSLMKENDVEFAHSVATGGDVPGKNWAERAGDMIGSGVDAVQGMAGDVADFVGDVANVGGDWIRDRAADLTGVENRINEMDSTGDKFTVGLGGELGAFGVQGGAAAQMDVEKTDEGYRMTLSGEISAGVFAELDIPGLADAGAEANATGKVSVEMNFATREEAVQAARTIAGITASAAAGGPVGAALTTATAGDELANIHDHISKTRVELELSGEVSASLGSEGGLGFGGGGRIEASNSLAVEWKPGETPELVLQQELSGSASLNLGPNARIPGTNSTLNLASAGANGSVSLETRLPVPGLDLGDLRNDPLGTIRNIGQDIKDNATTKISMNVDVNAGTGLKIGDVNIGQGGGLNVSVSAEARTRDLTDALGQVFDGDLGGAIRTLGDRTNLDIEINAFEKSGLNIDESFSAGVFKVGVKAQYESRNETDIFSFEGTASELYDQAGEFFDSLSLSGSSPEGDSRGGGAGGSW